MLVRTWSKWNSYTLLMGIEYWKMTLENSLSVSLKVKHIPAQWSNTPTLRCFPKRNKNICLHKNLYMNVYSIFIYNCQNLETTQMFFSRWMVRHPVVHPFNGILLSDRKELPVLSKTCMNPKSIELSERAQTQKATYCVISFIWSVQSRHIGGTRKEISGCQGLGEGKMGNDCLMDMGFLLEWWECSGGSWWYLYNLVNVTKLYTLIQLKWWVYVIWILIQ